jgi:hypothetical protein
MVVEVVNLAIEMGVTEKEFMKIEEKIVCKV